MRHRETIMYISLGVITILFLILIWREVRKLNPLISALQGAVSDNTAATNAAVAALGNAGGLSDADKQTLKDVTSQVVANTAALTNATPTGGAPPPPAP